MPTKTSPAWLDDETLAAVRPVVRAMLESSSAFSQLPPEEQKQIAQGMVKISSYMANPDGLAAHELSPRGGVLARAQEDSPVTNLQNRLAGRQGFAGDEFRAGAVREGVQQFRQMVQAVDFPQFVSGLVQNVFQAIVDSSIQQMRAYGELIANVAKTVDQFASDNISEGNARDWLAERYPGDLSVQVGETSGFATNGDTAPQATLTATSDNPEAFYARVTNELGLAQPINDISDPNEELRLVMGARLQMARARQQLLSSMVLLGINRIVVTDGAINAKVVFDMRASDVATRKATASMLDEQRSAAKTRTSASYGGWFSPVKANFSAEASTEHVATVTSSVDESSESRAEVKAKLTGEVRLNFKSDYLPMEKMATPEMISTIQGNAQPLARPVEGA